MRSQVLAIVLCACASSACPRDRDAQCETAPECAGASEGAPCDALGTSCNLCMPLSNHPYLATCEAGDGGLAWRIARGTPPPGCPP